MTDLSLFFNMHFYIYTSETQVFLTLKKFAVKGIERVFSLKNQKPLGDLIGM